MQKPRTEFGERKQQMKIMIAKQQFSQAHIATPAEAAIMAAVDQIIDALPQRGAVLIDYDFIRDYTVAKLQTHFIKNGCRAYTACACACVYLSRNYYTRKKIGHKKF